MRALDRHATPRSSPLIYRGSVCGDTLQATPGESSLVLLVACTLRPRDLPLLIYRGSVCGDTLYATPGESSLLYGVESAGTGPACVPDIVPCDLQG